MKRQARNEPPRILAITPDNFVLKEIRLRMPLLNLQKQGLIRGFFIADEFLSEVPDDALFDAVWLQRVENRELTGLLKDRLGGCFLYDIDDLLIGNASYLRVPPSRDPQGVILALEACKAVSVTSHRLTALLERYSGLSLSSKAVVCPNGFEFPRMARHPERPAALLWTSQDHAALVHSRDGIFDALVKFSGKHKLPVFHFGYIDEKLLARLARPVNLGTTPYWHHKALLASLPCSIGVAPLETSASPADLDFINSKSDIKMVEYGGLGHPAVYSNAPPYADTGLKTGLLADNDTVSWLATLEHLYGEGWKRSAEEQEQVMALRNMDRLAAENWMEAINRVRLEQPVKAGELKTSLPALTRGVIRRGFQYFSQYGAASTLDLLLSVVRDIAHRRWN